MKNLVILLILTMTCFFSCNKELLTHSDDQIVKENFKLITDGEGEIFKSLKTSSEKIIYEILYDYYLLFDSLINDEGFYSFLISKGLYIDTCGYQFLDILRSFNSYLNDTIFSEDFLFHISFDTNLLLESNQYYPYIYIPNFSKLNDNYKPIRAYGLDLESFDDSISDIIYGRYYDEYHNLNEIEVNEYNGLESTIPILIMTVDVDRSSLNYSNHHSYGIQEILQNNTFYKVTYYPYIDEYSIEHLYDRSNKAEYYERHTVYYQHSFRAEADWELIKKIHKKDLGKTFYDPDKQLDRDALPDGMWIVTFEYDFFTNKKPIVVTGPPYNCVIDCKLTFLHEWYQKSFFWMPTTGGSYVILTNKEGHCKIMTND